MPYLAMLVYIKFIIVSEMTILFPYAETQQYLSGRQGILNIDTNQY